MTDFHDDLAYTMWIVAASLAGLAVALVSITRRAPAFHASGHSVPAFLNGLVGSTVLLTAAPFLSFAGYLYLLGSDGLAWLVGVGGGLVLMGVLMAPAFRASGAVSVSDFLAARYGGRLLPLLATLVIGIISFALMVTQLAIIGAVVDSTFALHPFMAIGWAALVLAVALAGGGARAVTVLGILLGGVILVAYLAPLGAMALAQHGVPIGALTYGQTLGELRDMEVDLISSGLADAASLKPHLSQFLQIDHSNTLALIVTIMAGTAVLPHVLMRQAVTAGVRQTRMSMAWLTLMAAVVLSAVPAYAALTKHEVYRLVAKGVPLAELPVEFAHENVAVHGVSPSLYRSVINVVHPPIGMTLTWDTPGFALASRDPVDARDASAVSNALRQTATAQDFASWSQLSPTVHTVMLQAASADRLKGDAQHFETWRKTILPAAAAAAGNTSGKLTQGAIEVDDSQAVIFGMKLAGLGRDWIALFALGAVLAAFAAALATGWAVARCIGADLPRALRGGDAGQMLTATSDRKQTWPVRLAGVAVALTAAAASVVMPLDFGKVLAWLLSILAAGLFPALVMGIWWRRATASGALAGMVTGLAVTLAYIGGTQLAPDAVPRLTLPQMGQGEVAHDEVLTVGEDPAAMAAAEPAFGDEPIEPAASPAPTPDTADIPAEVPTAMPDAALQPAPWFGISDHAAAVFGLPLGLLVLIVVSLLSRRPGTATEQFVWAIRRGG